MQAALLHAPVPRHLRDELLPIAKHLFWWGTPEEWLEDKLRFVAQVMTYGDLNDIATISRVLGETAFCEVLDAPPPGVFDIKSWTFWHHRFKRPVPPLPQRKV